jgi:hypothetical protein
MICKECPHKKQLDALAVMDGAPDWVCDLKHSMCEDPICLMRMIIWQLSHLEEILNEENN